MIFRENHFSTENYSKFRKSFQQNLSGFVQIEQE